MNVSGVALQGLQQAAARVEIAAGRAGQAAAAGDFVDLSAEMVALSQSKNLAAAMVSVARASQQMDERILNILA
jgi:hypothetical protein